MTTRMLVRGGASRSPFALRVGSREEADRTFFVKRGRTVSGGGRNRLFHYISAGGMRQLRRTSADDLMEARRRSFLLFLGALAALWLLFYVVPCV